MTKISDPKLKQHIRQLYYLCDNFFSNTTEQRMVNYIIKEIKTISDYVSKHYAYDVTLKTFLNELPVFSERDVELITRSKKEKLISFLLFFISIPFALAVIRYDTNVLDSVKEKTRYNEKYKETARNKVISDVASISNLTIKLLEKFK